MIYISIITILFIVYAKKPQGFAETYTLYLKWILSPLVFIISLTLAFYERKRLKWLRKYWFVVFYNYFRRKYLYVNKLGILIERKS